MSQYTNDRELTPTEQEFLDVLDTDSVLIALRDELKAVVVTASKILADQVVRIQELGTTPEFVAKGAMPHSVILTDMLVDGVKQDLCYQTMDNVNPGWKEEIMAEMDPLARLMAMIEGGLGKYSPENDDGNTIH